ncbi:MAG TPA: GAF domain-containing sensor histidine kinase [Gemmatirosa sp.]
MPPALPEPTAPRRIAPWTPTVTVDSVRDAVRDPGRLAAVRGTQLLDAPAAPAVGRLVALAARLLRAPTALLTIVDGDRDVIKAHVGMPDEVAAAGEVRSFPSFCQVGIARHHAMRGRPTPVAGLPTVNTPGAGALLVIGDAENDAVFGTAFAGMPSVAMGVRACVTAPLLDANGQGVGSLCVIDFATRQWTDDELATLNDLANAAAGEIALHAVVAELAGANVQLQEQATELELQAEQMEAQQAELEAVNVDLQHAALAAATANAAKSQFLTTMSHELRTPLNAITGYVDLITMGIRGPTTPEQLADLARVRRSSQHLLALINDILNFARLEAGQVEVRREAVDLRATLADAEALVAPQVAARGLSLAVGAPATPVFVEGDAEKLRQILLNLLTNALKFTEPGGLIELTGEWERGGSVRVYVRDTGRGIPPDQLERVFEPFVQIDRHLTHQAQQGVGLGLAISRELARAMGGDLTVESRVGEGSRFTLALPRTVPAA